MTCRDRDLEWADALVLRALEIIEYLQPKHWFMENPQKGMLKSRPFMQNLAYVDVDYCRFAQWGYQKPTRIWGSPCIQTLMPRRCAGRECPSVELRENGFYGHKLILGATPNKGTRRVRLEDQYRIPVGVIEYVCGWNLSKDDIRSPENLISQIRLDDPQNHFIQPEDLRNCRHYFNGGEIVPHYGIPFRIKPPPWFPPPQGPVKPAPPVRPLAVAPLCGQIPPASALASPGTAVHRMDTSPTCGLCKEGRCGYVRPSPETTIPCPPSHSSTSCNSKCYQGKGKAKHEWRMVTGQQTQCS